MLCQYYSSSYTIEIFSNLSSLLLLMLICRSIGIFEKSQVNIDIKLVLIK